MALIDKNKVNESAGNSNESVGNANHNIRENVSQEPVQGAAMQQTKTLNFQALLGKVERGSELYRDINCDEKIHTFLDKLIVQAETATASNKNANGIKFALIVDQTICGIATVIGYSKTAKEYFALLLEDGIHNTNDLNDISENYNGHVILIDNDTSRFINDNFLSFVTKHVATISGVPDIKFRDYAIVKKGTLDDERYIAETAGVFYGTVASALRGNRGETAITLEDIASAKAYLLNDIQFHPGQTVSGVLDEPVAIDFKATVTINDGSTPHNANSPVELNSLRRSIDLATTGGVIDFVYVPSKNGGQQRHMQQYGPVFEPAFEPVIKLTYITGTSTKHTTAVEDVNTILYGLLAAAPMAAPMQYLSAFNRPGKASLGLLGMIWEPDMSAPTPTLEEINIVDNIYNANRKENELTIGEIAQRYIRETTNVTLVAEKGSRLGFAMRPFVEAATSASAANYLFKVVNDFTGGAFAKLWTNGQSIVSPQLVTLHAGHFPNKAGDVCDINQFGLLDLIAAHGKNAVLPQNIPAFSETLMPGMSQGDAAKYFIHRRRDMLESATGFTKTGLADQVFFHPDFFATFILACENSGVTMYTQGLVEVQNGTQDFSSWKSGKSIQGSSLFGAHSTGYSRQSGNSSYLHGDNFRQY
jgi:hypothetical protein